MLMAFLQLADVRRQLEAELQHLTASYGQLKAAQHRFRTCIEAVDSIDPSNEDKETLVPLTSSLYVPGKLSDLNKVIVDVGTGYYVEKSTEDAKQMYREKVEFVGKKLDQLQETILRKEDNMRVVRDVSMVVRRPFLFERQAIDALTKLRGLTESGRATATTATTTKGLRFICACILALSKSSVAPSMPLAHGLESLALLPKASLCCSASRQELAPQARSANDYLRKSLAHPAEGTKRLTE